MTGPTKIEFGNLFNFSSRALHRLDGLFRIFPTETKRTQRTRDGKLNKGRLEKFADGCSAIK